MTNTETIAIIEDSEFARVSLASQLRELGHDVVLVCNQEEASALGPEQLASLTRAVVDISCPPSSANKDELLGCTVIDAIRAANPDAVIVAFSSLAHDPVVRGRLRGRSVHLFHREQIVPSEPDNEYLDRILHPDGFAPTDEQWRNALRGELADLGINADTTNLENLARDSAKAADEMEILPPRSRSRPALRKWLSDRHGLRAIAADGLPDNRTESISSSQVKRIVERLTRRQR